MRYILLSALLFCAGCATTKQTPPPSVSTAQEAGDQNTGVAQKIDKALTLAEKLDALLEQIEKEAQQQANKNVIKP
jgi:hypothetical protein